MPEIWFANIQKFTNKILFELIPNVNNRYNSLIVVYSIKDKKYNLRTGGDFKKFY